MKCKFSGPPLEPQGQKLWGFGLAAGSRPGSADDRDTRWGALTYRFQQILLLPPTGSKSNVLLNKPNTPQTT